MKVAKVVFNFCILFFLVSALILKITNITIAGYDPIRRHGWVHFSEGPVTLVYYAIVFIILRIMLAKAEKKRKKKRTTAENTVP